jgi:hypothetical protein
LSCGLIRRVSIPKYPSFIQTLKEDQKMKFNLSKIAAALSLAIATGNAQAVLTSSSTLSIQNDAITAYTASGTAYVSGDGPLADSFFTMVSTSQTKQTVDTQFAYLYNGASMTLSGAIQSNIATFVWYGQAGSFETPGPGVSILSASGDTATVDMSGWNMQWSGIQFLPLGTGAWSAGYSNGVGNLTCTAGSGCAVGSAYTLKYTATIPLGEPSCCGGVKYYLELHGTVGAVPEASTWAMMLAGLGLVGAMARRMNRTKA